MLFLSQDQGHYYYNILGMDCLLCEQSCLRKLFETKYVTRAASECQIFQVVFGQVRLDWVSYQAVSVSRRRPLSSHIYVCYLLRGSSCLQRSLTFNQTYWQSKFQKHGILKWLQYNEVSTLYAFFVPSFSSVQRQPNINLFNGFVNTFKNFSQDLTGNLIFKE